MKPRHGAYSFSSQATMHDFLEILDARLRSKPSHGNPRGWDSCGPQGFTLILARKPTKNGQKLSAFCCFKIWVIVVCQLLHEVPIQTRGPSERLLPPKMSQLFLLKVENYSSLPATRPTNFPSGLPMNFFGESKTWHKRLSCFVWH